MNEMRKGELTKKEEEEIRKIINETTDIYDFIQKNNLYQQWMGDSERFMGFTFVHTKNLLKHSITLSKLTGWLMALTIALLISSIVQIFLTFF